MLNTRSIATDFSVLTLHGKENNANIAAGKCVTVSPYFHSTSSQIFYIFSGPMGSTIPNSISFEI